VQLFAPQDEAEGQPALQTLSHGLRAKPDTAQAAGSNHHS
jgi:hypothetical protein